MADLEVEEQIFDPSMKKKKKKKKTTFDLDSALSGSSAAVSQEEPAGANAEEAGKENNLSDIKENQQLEKQETTQDLEDEFSLSTKKKKKSDSKKTVKIKEESQILGDNEPAAVPKVSEGEYANTTDDYTYDQLLTRAFNIMRERNPDMESGERKRFVMKPPQLARVGTKKTAYTNFADVCKLLKRQPKHLLQFLLAELGTSGNVDANNQLILKGRYQQKHIETVLRRYIKEYVTCHTCRSPETLLERETRLFFLTCQNCGSRSSVASIKSGFQAVTGKRAAIRAKTA